MRIQESVQNLILLNLSSEDSKQCKSDAIFWMHLIIVLIRIIVHHIEEPQFINPRTRADNP
jgi:hypothetical protein